MGTKAKPGRFDCYGAALPDEPLFVLLGRDPLAPLVVRMWADLRELTRGRSQKVSDAGDCSLAMENWRKVNEAPSTEAAGQFLRRTYLNAVAGHSEVRAYTYAEVLELMTTFAMHRRRMENP